MTTTVAVPTRRALDDARVLVVDDDIAVVDALRRQLHAHVDVSTATDVHAALAAVAAGPAFSVVVSDMRMPYMDGAAFLREVRKRSPDTVRVLLTGQADLDAAVSAVNEGWIFRFLWKPCPSDVLLSCLRDAVAQHRLITAERELVEHTLLGSVRALVHTLSLANPLAFARAERIERQVRQLTAALDVPRPWHIEVAAMLSQIGTVSLTPSISERLHRGEPLTPSQRASVDQLPESALAVLASIPRLEQVCDAIRYERQRYDGRGPVEPDLAGDDIPLGARLLRVAVDYDALEARGMPAHEAVEVLRSSVGAYDPHIVATLEGLHVRHQPPDVRDIGLHEMTIGMILADDVKTPDGLLLCGKGQEITQQLVERLRNWGDRGQVHEPLYVIEAPARGETQPSTG